MTDDHIKVESSESWHRPVLVQQVLELLGVGPGKSYCDGTLGGGGHASMILEACGPHGRLFGLDRDPEALARSRRVLAPYGQRATTLHGNFGEMVQILGRQGVHQLDGLLLDLGVSSHQLTTAGRGFSLRHDGPLDMRMDPTRGPSVVELLERWSESELARIIGTLGEERASRRIARAIKASLAGKLETTAQLARVIREALPAARRRKRIHPATRTFQALRMALNGELEALDAFLQSFDQLLRPGGRVVIISFHSLEDRAVKRRLVQLANPCTCPPGLPLCACGLKPTVSLLTRKPRRPGEQELQQNPRSRSARLRAAEVL